MSEFINKAKIANLQHSNAELSNEISSLQIELDDLNGEVERLRGENPDDIKYLTEKITEYEQRETEFKERILSISEEVKNNPQKHDVVKELLSLFQVMEPVNVKTAIDNYYKKKWRPKVVTSFLLGILISMISCIFVAYLENGKHYNAIIKQLINNNL